VSRPSLVSIVPLAHPYNSIYLQAQMMHDALGAHFDTSPGPALAEERSPADITLVHYGSFDRHARALSGVRGSVFVFHGITPALEALPWNPLSAARAFVGYRQLRTLPKEPGWIALSGFSAGVLRAHGFRRVEEARCLIPTHSEASERAGSPRSNLLFVGRISPSKRPLELIDVFEHLHDRFPKLTLRIVGAMRKHCWYGRTFARRVRTSRARNNIVWQSSAISLPELQTLYRESLLYVSCSAHEGCGVPVLEAISFCTPALYTPCGGTESLLSGAGLLRGRGARKRADEIAGFIGDVAKRNALLASQRALLPQFSRESAGEMLARAIRGFSGPGLAK
jgi:glycosyltransferase involved in cell wall biosynthesis